MMIVPVPMMRVNHNERPSQLDSNRAVVPKTHSGVGRSNTQTTDKQVPINAVFMINTHLTPSPNDDKLTARISHPRPLFEQ